MNTRTVPKPHSKGSVEMEQIEFETIDEVYISAAVGYITVSINEDERMIKIEPEDEDPKFIEY